MRRFFIWICLAVLPVAVHAADTWYDVTIPDAWRTIPSGEQAPIDGYSRYRAFVTIPEEWADGELALFVEALDDSRSAWVNGSQVGVHGRFPPQFRSGLGEPGRFNVPAQLIRPGQVNMITLRVYQSDPRTRFNVAPPVLLHPQRMEAIRMNGAWQYQPGDEPIIDPADDFEAPIEPFTTVHDVTNVDQFVAWREGDRNPLDPKSAEAAFQIADDLRLELVLSEPDIAQPLFMTWDERGRMWVIEYRQYPDPAGLTMISRDVFLRSVYDKVPLPPPHGVPGRDRISIHEDTDGDGTYDAHSTFVDGLNIATSVAVGRGGAFVTNPPYLLFYPDKDADDIPDGDPEVLLEGFGIEDSHSVINSLTFGPDGWLYGCQGSTVTAQVRRPGSDDPPIQTMGQQIWRYHPERRVFEVFAEGGGNTFGLEFDAHGQAFSGHNGGDTRGFHYVQGAYYRKGFEKHGSLSNPYAFGYFEAMKHHSVPRFTHAFVIYESTHLPERYRGHLLGVEPLQGQVVFSEVQPDSSSFRTQDIERVVQTDDPWFRPVDIKTGPDGCVYFADLYEQRIDHAAHYSGRIDRSNGRIYRLAARDQPAPFGSSLDRDASAGTLLAALTSPDKWTRQTAVRLLGDRPDDTAAAALQKQITELDGTAALASLWGLHAVGGLNDQSAAPLLGHSDEFVRAWTVRLLGDSREIPASLMPLILERAISDPSIQVRKQLAATARRLTAADGIPILDALLDHDGDADDLHQPLMLWWAVETHAATPAGRNLILRSLENDARWERVLVRDHIVERLMKRFVLSGEGDQLEAAARLLRLCPDSDRQARLVNALEENLGRRSIGHFPQTLLDALNEAGGGSLALRVRRNEPDAVRSLFELIRSSDADPDERMRMIQLASEIRLADCVPVLLSLLEEEQDERILDATLNALHAWSDDEIGQTVIARIAQLSPAAVRTATGLLAARPQWSLWLLEAVSRHEIESDLIAENVIRRILLHSDPQIQQMVRNLWPGREETTTDEMRQQTQQLHDILAAATGNPKSGKQLYMTNCGKCHVLFQEGGRIGPDLTSYQRSQVDRLVQNIVNPSLEIREGFENFLLVTEDGQVATGFLISQDHQIVVLRTPDGATQSFSRDEIDELQALPESVMPTGTLKDLTEQQIRDLFAYLRSSQPVNY